MKKCQWIPPFVDQSQTMKCSGYKLTNEIQYETKNTSNSLYFCKEDVSENCESSYFSISILFKSVYTYFFPYITWLLLCFIDTSIFYGAFSRFYSLPCESYPILTLH